MDQDNPTEQVSEAGGTGEQVKGAKTGHSDENISQFDGTPEENEYEESMRPYLQGKTKNVGRTKKTKAGSSSGEKQVKRSKGMGGLSFEIPAELGGPKQKAQPDNEGCQKRCEEAEGKIKALEAELEQAKEKTQAAIDKGLEYFEMAKEIKEEYDSLKVRLTNQANSLTAMAEGM